MLDDDAFMIPAGVYSLFMFINGGLFAKFMHSEECGKRGDGLMKVFVAGASGAIGLPLVRQLVCGRS